MSQELILVKKDEHGKITLRKILDDAGAFNEYRFDEDNSMFY